jgi:hypothetical protein
MLVFVSDLETYRYYRQNEDVTLEQCLAQLRRETPPSPAMAAGRALHGILEHADCSEPDGVISVKGDGYQFHFACDVDLAVPDVRELKGGITIATPSGEVKLWGAIDAMDTAIYDYKLTGQFNAERFMDSYQWRCYLTIFGGDKFVYRVFVGKENSEGTGFDGEGFSGWTIYDYHELPVYRYPGMESDVRHEVAAYAKFAQKYLHGGSQ